MEEFDEDCSYTLLDFATIRKEDISNHPFTYNLTDVGNISDVLGISWEPSKDVPFSVTPTFIGFTWDLDQHTVSLTESKWHKYLMALQDWAAKRTHTLHEVQKLLSKLTHASQIFPEGHLYLANLKAMLTICGHKPFIPHTPPKGTQNDIEWWARHLGVQASPAPIQIPHTPIDGQAYSDASLSIGIGIHLQGRWHAWALQPEWNSNGSNIGWAEAVGLKLLAHTFLSIIQPSSTLLIHGDNQGVVKAWYHSHSRNKHVNCIFKWITGKLVHSDCHIITRYIPSRGNPANPLSHGIFPPNSQLLPPIYIPIEPSHFLADPTSSSIPTTSNHAQLQHV